MLPSVANAYVSPEIQAEANRQIHESIDREQAHLAEKGIKESLIDKAVEIDNTDILLEDEVAIKWFHLKKYGNKDCFESMPFELTKKYFGTILIQDSWKDICKQIHADGDKL